MKVKWLNATFKGFEFFGIVITKRKWLEDANVFIRLENK